MQSVTAHSKRRFIKATKPSHKQIRFQQGQALIMLMMVILLMLITGAMSYFDPKITRVKLEERTQESLTKAKEALIAYAVTRYDLGPGVFVGFPCPDSGISPANSREGVQGPQCGSNNANAIGRLPWRTIGIEPIKDGSGECLWYAVSGHYKVNNNAPLLNEDSRGLLLLYEDDGLSLITPTPDSRPVAAVFAPGEALAGQNRIVVPGTYCGGDYSANNFLESVGVADNANFSDVPYTLDRIARSSATSGAVINDRVVTVSRAEIWDAIRRRNYPNLDPAAVAPTSLYPADIFEQFTVQLAQCIANYGLSHGGNDLRLPWAVPVNLVNPTAQLYSQEDNYQDQANNYGGRFPFLIPDTRTSAGYPPSVNNLFVDGNCFEFEDLGVAPPASSYPFYENLWNHWKDHVFYAVAQARAPGSANPSQACGANDCLTVNNQGNYAAIVFFAGSPLVALGQARNTLPDPDQKVNTANYLEGGNAAILDAENGASDYQRLVPSPNFNDIMVCVDQNMALDRDCDP